MRQKSNGHSFLRSQRHFAGSLWPCGFCCRTRVMRVGWHWESSASQTPVLIGTQCVLGRGKEQGKNANQVSAASGEFWRKTVGRGSIPNWWTRPKMSVHFIRMGHIISQEPQNLSSGTLLLWTRDLVAKPQAWSCLQEALSHQNPGVCLSQADSFCQCPHYQESQIWVWHLF